MLTVDTLSEEILQNLLVDLTQQTISTGVCSFQRNTASIENLYKTKDLFYTDANFQSPLQNSKKENSGVSASSDDSANSTPVSSFIPSSSQTVAGLNNKTLNQAGTSETNGMSSVKLNLLSVNSENNSKSSSSTPAPGSGLISTALVNNLKDEIVYLTCDNCNRSIATNRFAQHLERCFNARTRK